MLCVDDVPRYLVSYLLSRGLYQVFLGTLMWKVVYKVLLVMSSFPCTVFSVMTVQCGAYTGFHFEAA